MTAEQQAKELVFYYTNLLSPIVCDEMNDFFISRCVKCALICIDKLIEQNGELYLNGLDGDYYRAKNAELFEIKQEIEKL